MAAVKKRDRLFLRGDLADVGFLLTADLVLAVLQLSSLLARALLLRLQARADQAVLRLRVQSILQGVIDDSKSSRSLTTECGAESEGKDSLVIVDLVLLREDILQVLLRHRRLVRVEDIQNLIGEDDGEEEETQ